MTMRVCRGFSLIILTLIGSIVASLATAQEVPEVEVSVAMVQIDEDTWQIDFTYHLPGVCTVVDSYESACPTGCSYTFIGSTSTGNCDSLSVPGQVSLPDESGGGETTEGYYTVTKQYGGCYMIVQYECIWWPVPTCFAYGWGTVGNCWRSNAKTTPGRQDDPASMPLSLAFKLSSRNPTTGPTVFRLDVPESFRGAREELAVFDPLGRRVRTLFSGDAVPGSRIHAWDLRTDQGARARGGVYYARYRLGNETRKQTVVISQ